MALTNAYCTLSDVKNALAIEDINDDLAIGGSVIQMTSFQLVKLQQMKTLTVVIQQYGLQQII